MAVQATLHHMTSTDDWPVHHMCPEGENFWCSYNKAKAGNELDEYKHGFDSLHRKLFSFSNLTIIDWVVDSFCLNACSDTLRMQTNLCTPKCGDSVPNTCFFGPRLVKIGFALHFMA